MSFASRGKATHPPHAPALWLLTVVLALGSTGIAAADSTARSAAYGEQVQLTLLPLLGGPVQSQSGPLPAVEGVAPPAYSLDEAVLSVSVPTLPALGSVLRSDTLNAQARSPLPLGQVAEASAAVEGLGIAVLTLLALDADLVTSEVVVQPAGEDCSSGLAVGAHASLSNAFLGGTLVPGGGLAIPVNPAPNTVVLDVPGVVRVVANEQGIDGLTTWVNALHVTLGVSVPLAGVLSGDIVISHSEASVECDLEPPTPQADLALSLSDSPDPVVILQVLTTTWTVTNYGPNDAEDVTVTIDWPSSVELMAVPSGCTEIPGGLVCSAGDVPAGGSASGSTLGRPQATALVVLSALAESATEDPDPLDNEAAETTLVVDETVVEPPDAEAVACKVGIVPAATLLVPYFEVDLDDPSGRTTLLSVNNTTAEPILAQVTLWTDWAVPTLAFPIYLTGYDVQSLNLRDALVQGVLPATGSAVSPHGQQSGSAFAYPGCPGRVTEPLSAAEREDLRALHVGLPSTESGLCAASERADTTLATGYVTVDVVSRCSSLTPADSGYFGGADAVARDHNALWGDVFFVDPGGNFAQGEPAVHLEADPGRFISRTFYRRYTGGADHRQPLGSVYGSRYLVGGAFSGGTELVVWRDTGSAAAEPRACGELPAWAPLRRQASLAFDEEENGVALPPTTDGTPWATQKVVVGSAGLPTPAATGWLRLDLARDALSQSSGRQAWVTTILSAEDRYSLAYPAIQLDDPCDP